MVCGGVIWPYPCEPSCVSSGTAQTPTSVTRKCSLLSMLIIPSGARCLTVALTAIWPSYGTMKNTLPLSADITTRDLVSFVLFMLGFVALSCVHSRDLKWFYTFKSIYVFGAMHAVLIWWMVKNGGAGWGNLRTSTTSTMATTTRAWLVLRAFNSGLGTASSLTVNQGDMTRYANKPSAVIWVST